MLPALRRRVGGSVTASKQRARLALVLFAALLLSLVEGVPNAASAPIRPPGEIAVDLGMETPLAVVHIDANDRLVVVGDDEAQILSTSGQLLHRIENLPSVTAVDVVDTRAVVAVDGNSELVVIDTNTGSIVRRIPSPTNGISSVSVAGDTVWFTHGADQWDGEISRALLSTGTVTSFPLSGSLRAAGAIDVSPGLSDTVFSAPSDLSNLDIDRHSLDEAGQPVRVRGPYSSDLVPFAVADRGDVIWAFENGTLTEFDASDLTRTGVVFDRFDHDRYGRTSASLAIHGDEFIALADQGFVFTYRTDSPAIVAVADFDVRIVDVDLDGDRLFTLQSGAEVGMEPTPSRVVISGLERVRPDRVVSFRMEAFGSARSDRPTLSYSCDDGTQGTFTVRYGWTYDIDVAPDVEFCRVERSRFPLSRQFLFASDGDGPWALGGGPTARMPSIESGASAIVRTLDLYYTPLEDTRLFVELQYRDILGRASDDGGADFWTARIREGGLSRSAYVESLVDSPEYLGSIAPVTRLYSAYFGRAPDAGGLEFWLGAFRSGMSLEEISSHFAASDEFRETYGTLDDRQFVDLVYRNVLERSPDEDGRRFWLDRVQDGLTRGAVMTAFSESPEYIHQTNPRIVVSSLYRGLLQREPDPSGLEFWEAEYRAGRPLTALIDGFIASDEYAARFWVVDPPVDDRDTPSGGRWSLTETPRGDLPRLGDPY